MKISIARSHAILIATLSAWLASLTLVLFPVVRLTTPVYTPTPAYTYKLIGLVITACTASAYSMYLGIKHLFPEGIGL